MATPSPSKNDATAAPPPIEAPYDVLLVRSWKPPCDVACLLDDLLGEQGHFLGNEFVLRVPTAQREAVVHAVSRRAHVCSVVLLVPGEPYGRRLMGRANDSWIEVRRPFVRGGTTPAAKAADETDAPKCRPLTAEERTAHDQQLAEEIDALQAAMQKRLATRDAETPRSAIP